MIISERFIWLHFPKCSGTETERLLKLVAPEQARIHFDEIDLSNVIWHQNVSSRITCNPTFSATGKDVICNIRRLPSWLLSRIHFEYWRAPQHKVTRSMLLRGEFFENDGTLVSADTYASYYTTAPVEHWIRTEFLADDFYDVFSRYFDVSKEIVVQQMAMVNASQLSYIRDLRFFFENTDLQRIYAANPVWADIEHRVYGELVSL